MHIEYFLDTDTLYIRLAGRTSAESQEIAPNSDFYHDLPRGCKP